MIDWQVIIAGICTIAIYTYLYKENPAYRLGEHLLIGISLAHLAVMSVSTIQRVAISPLLNGEVIWIIPILLGLLLFFFYVPTYAHLYRIPISIMVGVGTALSIRGAISAQLFGQIIANLKLQLSDLNNILIVGGSILVLYYFIFTFGERKSGSSFYVEKVARWFIMAGFGAMFGNIVQGRVSATIGRLQSLLLSDAIYLIPISVILFVVYLIYESFYKKSASILQIE